MPESRVQPAYLISRANLADFCAVYFSPSCWSSTTEASPCQPAVPLPAPVPTFRGRARDIGNWGRQGHARQRLVAAGSCEASAPWRGATPAIVTVRRRRAGCRQAAGAHQAGSLPAAGRSRHRAPDRPCAPPFILFLWQVAWSRLISTSCLKSISGLFASFYL